MKVSHILALAGMATLIGCQGGPADLPPKEDQALRGKIDQGLSPEEIEKHFGKDYMKNNAGGGAPSAPTKSKG